MEPYKVVLFGHRYIEDLYIIEKRLFSILSEIVKEKEFVEFYIGRNGEFDEYAASVIKRVQKRCVKENTALILVLPYEVKDIVYYEHYYDEIIIPETLGGVHPKRAIRVRNEWMVEVADLLIVAIEHNEGGAYRALKYAEGIGKNIFHLLGERAKTCFAENE